MLPPQPTKQRERKVSSMEARIQKKPNALKSKSTPDQRQIKEVITDKTLNISRRSSASISSPVSSKPIKRKNSMQNVDLGPIPSSMAIPRKKKERSESISVAKPADVFGQPSQVSTSARRGGRQWGRRTRDRYAELDSSIAVAVNAGDRPTLKNSRKELAAQKSKVTVDMVQLVLADLLEKIHKSLKREELNETLRGRKNFWKREFSELTKEDFKAIWEEVKRKYTLVTHREINDNASSKSVVVDSTAVDRDGDDDEDAQFVSSLPVDATEESAIETTVRQEPPKPYHDRWSHLFVGPTFRMGNELTLEDLEYL
jgi:hypothetical protein